MFKDFSKQSPRRDCGFSSDAYHELRDQSIQTDSDDSLSSFTTPSSSIDQTVDRADRAMRRYEHSVARLKKHQNRALSCEEELLKLGQENDRIEAQIDALKKYQSDLKVNIQAQLELQGKDKFKKFKSLNPPLFQTFKSAKTGEEYLSFIRLADEHFRMLQLFSKIAYNNYVAEKSPPHETPVSRKAKRIKATDEQHQQQHGAMRQKKIKKQPKRRIGLDTVSQTANVVDQDDAGVDVQICASQPTETNERSTDAHTHFDSTRSVISAMLQARVDQQFNTQT